MDYFIKEIKRFRDSIKAWSVIIIAEPTKSFTLKVNGAVFKPANLDALMTAMDPSHTYDMGMKLYHIMQNNHQFMLIAIRCIDDNGKKEEAYYIGTPTYGTWAEAEKESLDSLIKRTLKSPLLK